MKTIILNGSPKANIKESNTEIFINEFMKDMKEKCTVKYIAREEHSELANSLKEYDTILIFLPLYIHAMPGMVMKFIEKLESTVMEGKNLGFLIQAGFPETAQEQYIVRYFKVLCKELKCNYIGTVCKGEAAAAYMFPKNYKKTFAKLNELGRIFEATGKYDEQLIAKLGYPYTLSDYSPVTLTVIKVCYKLGLCDLGWKMMLKKNNALDRSFDKPFTTTNV